MESRWLRSIVVFNILLIFIIKSVDNSLIAIEYPLIPLIIDNLRQVSASQYAQHPIRTTVPATRGLAGYNPTYQCFFNLFYAGFDSEGVAVIWSQISCPHPPLPDAGWTQSCVSSVVGLCLAGTAALNVRWGSFSGITQEESRFWQILIEALEETVI